MHSEHIGAELRGGGEAEVGGKDTADYCSEKPDLSGRPCFPAILVYSSCEPAILSEMARTFWGTSSVG
jgi:hypothetical protein